MDDPDGFAPPIAGLPPRQRAVLIPRYHEDLSTAETARILGIRKGTVRVLAAQAVARLRREPSAVEELR